MFTMSRDHAQLHAHTGAADAAVAALRTHGERVTAPRRAVLDALAGADALTADDVVARVSDAGIHRATVYRTLDLLADRGVAARRLVPDGASRYHLAATAPGHEHLHAHCRVCGAVVSVPSDVLAPAVASVAASGFDLDPAHSTLTGRCANCR